MTDMDVRIGRFGVRPRVRSAATVKHADGSMTVSGQHVAGTLAELQVLRAQLLGLTSGDEPVVPVSITGMADGYWRIVAADWSDGPGAWDPSILRGSWSVTLAEVDARAAGVWETRVIGSAAGTIARTHWLGTPANATGVTAPLVGLGLSFVEDRPAESGATSVYSDPAFSNGRVLWRCRPDAYYAGSATIMAGPSGMTGDVTEAVAAGAAVFTAPGEHDWVVPSGVTTIRATVVGGAGGAAGDGTPGGRGARVATDLAVTPGETLRIVVGTPGASGRAATPSPSFETPYAWTSPGSSPALAPPIITTTTPGGDGAVGGGDGGAASVIHSHPYVASAGGGGGASDIRQGGTTSSDRVVIAAGGGGAAAGGQIGGDASGWNGQAGSAGQGGRGGTATAPGAGGDGIDPGAAGTGADGGDGATTAAAAAFKWSRRDPYPAGGGYGAGRAIQMIVEDDDRDYAGGGGGGGGLHGGGGGGSGKWLDAAGRTRILSFDPVRFDTTPRANPLGYTRGPDAPGITTSATGGGAGSSLAPSGATITATTSAPAVIIAPGVDTGVGQPIDGIERSTIIGRQIPDDPWGWELTNGIVRVRPCYSASEIGLAVATWTGTGWSDETTVGVAKMSSGVPVSAASQATSINLLRNAPETATLRTLWSDGDRLSAHTLDITLRRGAWYAETHFTSSKFGQEWGWAVSPAEPGTVSGPDPGTFLIATTAGTAGEKWVLMADTAAASDVYAAGHIDLGTTRRRLGIGHVLPGETAADMVKRFNAAGATSSRYVTP